MTDTLHACAAFLACRCVVDTRYVLQVRELTQRGHWQGGLGRRSAAAEWDCSRVADEVQTQYITATRSRLM